LSILDQTDRWESLDPGAMRDLIQSFPAQIEDAAQEVRTLSLTSATPIANVVVAGMGGSALGGDVIRATAASWLEIPFLVCRDYRLPRYVGPSTILFASSYSGNTEETLSAYEQARLAGAGIICITSGGKLASLARSHGHPVIPLPSGLPPRAALGYSTVFLLGALTALKLAPDMSESLRETVAVLKRLVAAYAPGVPLHKNRAKLIAHTIQGRVVALYASNAIMEPAAVRWRGQLEENAKNLAFHHLLPEMNHNEIVGWDMPSQLLGQIAVVFLRDMEDHPQVRRRFDLTREIVARKASPVYEVWSEGESPLARIFSVICLGDFVSLYLACLNSVDPTPVAVIETLKQALGRSPGY
jgi:glucose/mannose-6-phosphate isomerase